MSATLLTGSFLLLGSLSVHADEPADEAVLTSMERYVLPHVKLNQVTLEEAVHYLRTQTRQITKDGSGVNFVIKPSAADVSKSRRFNLEMSNAPIHDVVQALAKLAGVKARVDSYAVVFCSINDPGEMRARVIAVPPDFISGSQKTEN